MWCLTWEVLLVPVAVLLLLLLTMFQMFQRKLSCSSVRLFTMDGKRVPEWMNKGVSVVRGRWMIYGVDEERHFHSRTTATTREEIKEKSRRNPISKMGNLLFQRRKKENVDRFLPILPLSYRCNKFKYSRACELMRLNTIHRHLLSINVVFT